MEHFSGLCVLTTNFKDGLDKAFIRRIKYFVDFSFPSIEERTSLWEALLPDEAPTHNLHMKKLARLKLSGGQIRNVLTNAAFYAAADTTSDAIHMRHIRLAAEREYRKTHQALPVKLVMDWT